jgi:pimeloyl-ACP methyl ester carboxylesterase
MVRLRLTRTLVAIPLVIGVSVACTSSGGGADGAFRPTFEEVPCPDDVANVVLTFVSCGYLTVLEDRSEPEGGTIRLFVTKIEPPDGPVEPDPMFTIGYDLASIPSYASIGPLSQRMSRVTYLMDQRGAGHSERLLECPEVSELSERMLGARLSDPSARGDLLDAVGRCRDRLVDEGVDLSAYTLEQSAADIEDLRRTLDIPSWNIISWGSDSRVIFEVLRRFPEGIRSVILHGPQLPHLDPITEAPGETRDAIGEVAAVCAADDRCDGAYPDVEGALSRALERLEQDPIEVNVDDSRTAIAAGHPIRVVVDGSAFLRAIRNMISDPDLHRFAEVPGMIHAALDGEVSSVAAVLAEDVDTCAGYLPNCTIDYRFSHGAYYSALCHDMAGSVDRSALGESIEGEAAWSSAYAENPYLELCEVWDVGVGDPTLAEPVTSDVPILIFRGQFDAFSDRAAIDRSTRTLSAAQVIHVGLDAHDITRDLECYRAIRRAWLDEPTSPADAGCLHDVPTPEFVIQP